MKKTYIQPQMKEETTLLDAYMITVSSNGEKLFDVYDSSEGVSDADTKDRGWEEF